MPLVVPLVTLRPPLLHLILEALKEWMECAFEAVFLSHDGSSLENQDGHSCLRATQLLSPSRHGSPSEGRPVSMSLKKLASSSGKLVAWHHVRGSKTWQSYKDRDRKGMSSGSGLGFVQSLHKFRHSPQTGAVTPCCRTVLLTS